MKVFVTGASGFIGQAVTKELVANGHTVLGLARNDKSAEVVRNAGGEPLTGGLDKLDSLKKGAKASDGVIHLAFVHDFSGIDSYAKACETDRTAITAMGEVLAGTGKALIIASGTLGFPHGVLATEDMDVDRASPFVMRHQSADLVYEMSRKQNIRGMVVRLSPTVHEAGQGGFLELLKHSVRENGFSGYIGDGQTRWPTMNRQDAAVLFRLCLEKGKAGATYHGAAEEGVKMKDLAEVIGKKMGVPAESKTPEEATKTMGFAAHVIGVDNPCSSAKTQKELGWKPVKQGMLAEIEASEIA